MTDLVINSNGRDVTTSLIVAEVFGKTHQHVLRDIDALECSDIFRQSNFGLSFKIRELPNGGSKKERFYYMTKDGFSFLVMGYTGAKAGEFKERFINEFNKRERMLTDDDYILARSQEILQRRIAMVEQRVKQLEADNDLKQETIDRQNGELAKAAPKVNYYDATLQSVNTMTTTQVAKSIGMETHALNKKLKEIGVQFKQSSMWMLHAPYSGWKLTSTRTQMFTRSDGTTGTSQYTVWNERGRRFIVALSQNDWDVKKAVKEINGEKHKTA